MFRWNWHRVLMILATLCASDIEGVTDSFKHTILNWKQSLGLHMLEFISKSIC